MKKYSHPIRPLINLKLGKPVAEVHATELCRRLARLLSCGLTFLTEPGIIDNQQVNEALLSGQAHATLRCAVAV